MSVRNNSHPKPPPQPPASEGEEGASSGKSIASASNESQGRSATSAAGSRNGPTVQAQTYDQGGASAAASTDHVDSARSAPPNRSEAAPSRERAQVARRRWESESGTDQVRARTQRNFEEVENAPREPSSRNVAAATHLGPGEASRPEAEETTDGSERSGVATSGQTTVSDSLRRVQGNIREVSSNQTDYFDEQGEYSAKNLLQANVLDSAREMITGHRDDRHRNYDQTLRELENVGDRLVSGELTAAEAETLSDQIMAEYRREDARVRNHQAAVAETSAAVIDTVGRDGVATTLSSATGNPALGTMYSEAFDITAATSQRYREAFQPGFEGSETLENRSALLLHADRMGITGQTGAPVTQERVDAVARQKRSDVFNNAVAALSGQVARGQTQAYRNMGFSSARANFNGQGTAAVLRGGVDVTETALSVAGDPNRTLLEKAEAVRDAGIDALTSIPFGALNGLLGARMPGDTASSLVGQASLDIGSGLAEQEVSSRLRGDTLTVQDRVVNSTSSALGTLNGLATHGDHLGLDTGTDRDAGNDFQAERNTSPLRAEVSAQERRGAVEYQNGSARYPSDNSIVNFRTIRGGAVEQQFDLNSRYDQSRVDSIVADLTHAPELTTADGQLTYRAIPVRTGARDSRVPTLVELQMLSETIQDASSGRPSEVGLATRIGNPNEVLLIIGTHNSLPVPDGYRLAVHTHPGSSPPSPEDFNTGRRPTVIPLDSSSLLQGLEVSGYTTAPRYRTEDGTLPSRTGGSSSAQERSVSHPKVALDADGVPVPQVRRGFTADARYEQASALPALVPNSEAWVQAAEAITNGGPQNINNVRVTTASLAKRLLNAAFPPNSAEALRPVPTYTDELPGTYQIHPPDAQEVNDLPHIKWISSRGQGHIFFDNRPANLESAGINQHYVTNPRFRKFLEDPKTRWTPEELREMGVAPGRNLLEKGREPTDKDGNRRFRNNVYTNEPANPYDPRHNLPAK